MDEKQKQLLFRFIGVNSVFFEQLRNNEHIDIGSKITYLKKALSLSSESFLIVLDKLYELSFKDSEQAAQISLNGLKLLNDFYFNRTIDTGKPILEQYFGSLGAINHKEFQIFISKVIDSNISVLTQRVDRTLINRQKLELTVKEAHTAGNTAWRNTSSMLPRQLVAASLSNVEGLRFFEPRPDFEDLLGGLQRRIPSEPLDAEPMPGVRRKYTPGQLVTILGAMSVQKTAKCAPTETVGPKL